MGGAATVCASIVTAASLKLPVNIVGEHLDIKYPVCLFFKFIFVIHNMCKSEHFTALIHSGLAPLCENMPSGKATKPGDVVKAKNGKTIQVSGILKWASNCYLSVLVPTLWLKCWSVPSTSQKADGSICKNLELLLNVRRCLDMD